MLKNIKVLKTTTPAKDVADTVKAEIIQDQIKLNKIAGTSDLADTVRNIREQAQQNGDDASEILINTLHPQNIEAGQRMLKILDE